jgi:hypothetical protein
VQFLTDERNRGNRDRPHARLATKQNGSLLGSRFAVEGQTPTLG